MKNYSRFLTKKALLLLLFILTSKIIFGQLIDFCGTFPFHQALSSNPDSICWDRFGNSYDLYSDFSVGSDLNSGCQNGSGYYRLAFGNGIPEEMKDVFCQVFSDLSDSIQQRINIDGCGDTLPADLVRIEVRITPLGTGVLMAATPVLLFPFNYYCYPLGISLVERKINGSRNYSSTLTDGTIYINTGIQNKFYTNITDSVPNPGPKYDAYSVVLHEALHLLGYSSFMWLVHPDSLQGYSTWDKNIFTTSNFGTSTSAMPVITSDCQHNCWELNSELFEDGEDLLDALVNNCSSSGSLDFAIGNPILAPISGSDDNILPTTNGELSNLLSHLHNNCNGNAISYVMQPSIDTGVVRRFITGEELTILCSLGYKMNNCDGCYVVPYADTESTMDDIDACCETYFTACKNTPMEILFTELLCNDFSNGEIELTDVFPSSGNYVVTDSSIIITSVATGRIQFGYTIKGCDCILQNGYANVYVGVCNDCNEIDPCENLTCVNGFDGWDQGIGQLALHEYLTGVFWHTNLFNSVDVCKVSNNSFVHIGGSQNNREAMAFRLSEPVLPGCTIIVSYKASVRSKNVFNWHASRNAPCRFDDTVVSIDCILTQCESYEYSPQCIYSDTIVTIAEQISLLNNLCPIEPNLDSTYSFTWQNGFDFPINYLIVFPELNPLGSNNYIDDIIVTQSCLDSRFTFSFHEDCQEVKFLPDQMDSIYSHSWVFSDGDTSFQFSPTHVFESIDTFSVLHFISDSCGNTDSFELDVIIPEESTLCCPDTTISSSTTWDSGNLPHQGRFHTITVVQGVAFTINDDVELQFCEGGALIIEPGAFLDLEGDLTSYENMTWKGIYVTGDSSLNQSIDLNSGGFNGFQQGFLQTRLGASIKNAEIAVRNYGKGGSSSSGGMIRCKETLFQNNTIGTDFIEYQNFNDSINQPLPSLGSFTGCRFYTDTEYYLHDPFYSFARISKVDGIDFKACKFVNTLLPELPSQVKDFGFGILAKDATFKVHPIMSSGGIGTCPPPCTLTDSTLFHGLGHGIYIMTESQSRPYFVYHAVFENCLRGLTDLTRGGATVLYNSFSLGEVPDQEFSYGQIGAEFHFAHDGFTLQENLFVVKDEETEVIPIGVLCNGLGEFDNEIRKNTFIGVETANQAFDVNADLTLDIERGLVYFCNSFDETPSYGYDFHIPNTPDEDYIHPYQTSGSSQGSNISTGNHFAYSAQDFMNYGEGSVNYWYYPPGDNEEPRDSFSYNIEKDLGLINECSSDYCAPPCLEGIEDLKEDFYSHIDYYEKNLDNYLDALLSENPLKLDTARSKALYYRRLSSRDAYMVVQHMMIDTLEYHTDSLIAWIGHLDTYGAEVMIAGEYASDGDFESALVVLETIAARRDLSSAQSVDLAWLLEIYYLMEGKPLQSFSSTDRSFLRNIAYSNTGAASGVSRALLSSFGEYIPLPYYQGEQINFRNAVPDSTDTSLFIANQFLLSIYPNPSNSDITIDWKYPERTGVFLKVYDFSGQKVLGLKGEFKSPFKLETDDWKDGVHWIIVQDDEGFSHFGKVLIFRN